jgi:sulfur carrier protein
MIRITVNGRSVELNESMTIEHMLDSVDVPPNYLAVEVNAEVVPREEYTTHAIQDGDQIELVTLVGGG